MKNEFETFFVLYSGVIGLTHGENATIRAKLPITSSGNIKVIQVHLNNMELLVKSGKKTYWEFDRDLNSLSEKHIRELMVLGK